MKLANCHALLFINFNAADLTLTAVRSAQRVASFPDALRILIVDNGSNDGSVDILRRELPEPEILPLPSNRGFAKAVNEGLRHVQEPYAFILNNDIEFRNDVFTILTEALEKNPLAILASPRLLCPDGSTQTSAGPVPKLFWELTNSRLPRFWLKLSRSEPTVVPAIVGPCMAVHMERLPQVGLLDERFFFFFEETDWCKRITDMGLHVLYVPTAEVVHLKGRTVNRNPVRARVQFYISRYKYFHKHYGPKAVGILFVGLWLRLTVNTFSHALLVTLTFGRHRFRSKFTVYAVLWYWH
ncbi:MAG: glycosyltransferase, partial [Desulfobacteraceae bacterium]|nr:glycosyltransferase [Desulfobacteraceae bacterium]